VLVVCLVAAGVNYLTGAVTRTVENVRAWAFDRDQRAIDEAVAAKDAEIETIRQERDALRSDVDVLRGQNAALVDTLEGLGANEQDINTALEEDRRKVEAAREGDPLAPVDRDTLTRDLRDLFPRRPRR
jgi:septal ring factor EnvC (AmiA/AmiB activator)